MANARRRAHRSKKYKTRKFRDAIEGAANNAVRPTPRLDGLVWLTEPQHTTALDRLDWFQAKQEAHEADHEADRLKARLRLTRLLRGIAPQNLSWALGHANTLIRETALTGLTKRETK